MSKLKQLVMENLANGIPKKFNPELYTNMLTHARDHLFSVEGDIADAHHTAVRAFGRHEAGSVYDATIDHMADHLYDKFNSHPDFKVDGNGPSMARHVAKRIVDRYIHDDRPEFRAAVAKHKRQEAAKNRPPKAPKPKPQKATEPPKEVWVHTSGGMKLKTMRLPPFRKL
jgi:hypothetical protein